MYNKKAQGNMRQAPVKQCVQARDSEEYDPYDNPTSKRSVAMLAGLMD